MHRSTKNQHFCPFKLRFYSNNTDLKVLFDAQAWLLRNEKYIFFISNKELLKMIMKYIHIYNLQCFSSKYINIFKKPSLFLFIKKLSS